MGIIALTGKHSEICNKFFNIINYSTVKTVLQPIISLKDGSILGYEALSRGPAGTDFEMPFKMFEVAELCNALWELELLCRVKAIELFQELELKSKLFINVSPNIMNDHNFKYGFTKNLILDKKINPDDIIFEVTERYAVKKIEHFKKTVSHYKSQNYQIAIDDTGSGYSGLRLIAEIEPHYIKLDMNLIRGINKDFTKQAIIKGMVEYAKLTNTQIIAEGIETRAELKTLIHIGIDYGQGYLIQKPNSEIAAVSESVLNIIIEENCKKSQVYGYKITNIYIGCICQHSITVDHKMPMYKVDTIFKNDPTLPGFCVVDGNRIVGVVTKKMYYAKLSGRYGYSLYSKKTISDIANKDFLSVGYDTPIDIVAEQAMARPENTLYDFITVTKNGNYLGIATVQNLIKKAIEIEVINAKHLNPLTELPGNIIIEQCLNSCISSSEPFCALYIDIDNFKAFNDVYGFEKGDLILKALAEILQNNIPKNEFIGHIGGDDFVVVLKSNHLDKLCTDIMEQFQNKAKQFYTAKDLANGCLIAKNRHGIIERFPLHSLSIAGVTNQSCKFKTVYELSKKATDLKSKCKSVIGNCYIIE